MSDYQGWANRQTWAVNLWLTNTSDAYHQLMRIVDSPDIKASAKPNALRYYVISNVRGAQDLPLDSQGQRWAVGIRYDLSEKHDIDETMKLLNGVHWGEIIEANKE